MFKDKVVVVTGSVQGIGKRTAEMLAERGAKVVINSRTQAKVDTTVEEFTQKGFDVLGLTGDISDYNFCEELTQQTVARFGRVDYLINNAGLAAKGSLSDSTANVFEKMYAVNVLGSLYPTMALLPEIKKTKGGILFISSMAGIIGLPSYAAYSGTKRSIVSLAESIKNELVDDEVYVGVNYPGFTENDAKKEILSPSGEANVMEKREDVKVEPLDKTVNKIIRQIEKRKFRSYSSYKGRALQTMYRLFPTLSLSILKMNRRKIMDMQ